MTAEGLKVSIKPGSGGTLQVQCARPLGFPRTVGLGTLSHISHSQEMKTPLAQLQGQKYLEVVYRRMTLQTKTLVQAAEPGSGLSHGNGVLGHCPAS